MKKLIFSRFNMNTMYRRSELDWLIYNKPLEYAQLVLGGDLEQYV